MGREMESVELPFTTMGLVVIIQSKGDTIHSRVAVENAVAEVAVGLDQATQTATNLRMGISLHSPRSLSQWDLDRPQSSTLRTATSSLSPRENTPATRIAHNR